MGVAGRRLLRPSVVAILLVVLAPTARGQVAGPIPSAELGTIHCSVSSSVPLVRIEGTRELVGDVVLTCHNALPATGFEPRGFVEADIRLALNAPVSSRSVPAQGAGATEAVLVVNENHCPASSTLRTMGNCAGANGTVQDPMLGRADAGDRRVLRWSGVAIPIPGAAVGTGAGGAAPVADCSGRYGVAGGCHPPTTTIRLTNLRVDASNLGASARPGAATSAVVASLAVDATDSIVLLESEVLRVAQAAPGVAATLVPFEANRLCSHGETTGRIAISEGFSSAFKTAPEPSFRPGEPGWADGYYPIVGMEGAASARYAGTRIYLTLSGLPRGVDLEVPATVACSSAGSRLRLESGPTAPGGRNTAAGGPLSFTYEVASASPVEREECQIPFELSRSERVESLQRGATVELAAGFASVEYGSSTGSAAEDSGFVASAALPAQRFRLNSCGTTLFFPFVTNRNNFDSAIVISNTSADPLGTRHQVGRCTLSYHRSGDGGGAEPSIQHTAEVPAGKQLAFTLSSGNPAQGISPVPDFQGYMVSQCEFQHAQGFAFVTEQINGTAVLAQGYLAEVVRDPAEPEAVRPGPQSQPADRLGR